MKMLGKDLNARILQHANITSVKIRKRPFNKILMKYWHLKNVINYETNHIRDHKEVQEDSNANIAGFMQKRFFIKILVKY